MSVTFADTGRPEATILSGASAKVAPLPAQVARAAWSGTQVADRVTTVRRTLRRAWCDLLRRKGTFPFFFFSVVRTIWSLVGQARADFCSAENWRH